jgi:glutamine synthetase
MFRTALNAGPVYDSHAWTVFMQLHQDIRFVFVQWLDYMGTMRVRILPVTEFNKLIGSNQRISIAQGNTGILQNDTVTSAVNTTGQIYVEPDLTSLRPTWHGPAPAATVFSSWRNAEGLPIKECPRSGLQILLNELSSAKSIDILIGFEIEVTFLRRNPEDASDPYAPLTANHAWGTMTPEQWTHGLPLLFEISEALASINIKLQQFHAESGPGQYEFILPPLPPIQAIDTLYATRQVIAQVAESHGLRATLHPHSIRGTGTAAHAHMSLNSASLSPSALDDVETHFWAGVLAHLNSICAFSLPEKESYERVVEDHWTGGVWVAWGTQNREVPLRKAGDRRWEVRCLDGCANMYLAIGAIVASGLLGMNEGLEMEAKDCPRKSAVQNFVTTANPCKDNPARLDETQRAVYGITRRLPETIEEALKSLEEDSSLKSALAEDVVTNYIAMKRAEQDMLGKMSDKDRRTWLIERY